MISADKARATVRDALAGDGKPSKPAKKSKEKADNRDPFERIIDEDFLPLVPGWTRHGWHLVSPVENDLAKVVRVTPWGAAGQKIVLETWTLPLFVSPLETDAIPQHFTQRVPGERRDGTNLRTSPRRRCRGSRRSRRPQHSRPHSKSTGRGRTSFYTPFAFAFEAVAYAWVLSGQPAKAQKLLATAMKEAKRDAEARKVQHCRNG